MTQTINRPEAAGAGRAGAEAQVKNAKSAAKAAAAQAEVATGLDTAVPEAFRSMAEKAVTQSRDAYDNAKSSLEQTVETFEQSLDKAGQGAAAINRKVIDIAQSNVNTGFDLARTLAGARNLAEVFEAQAAFARRQFETMVTQAEDIRALTAKVATESAEPFKAHMTRSMETLKRAS